MTPLACEYDMASDVALLLARAQVDRQKLQGKCVFVTGATGFFGLWMLSALVAIKQSLGSDLRLVALSRNPDRFLAAYPEFGFDRQVEFIGGDVRHFSYGRKDVTHLVHMATTNAAETFAGEDQWRKLDLLYSGTQNVLTQCAGRLESVLMTSSGVAYGQCMSEPIRESDQGFLDTTDPRSALALGKLTAEYLVSTFSEKQGYRYSIARCFSFAGPHLPLDLHYAFGNFIANAVRKQAIVIQGDGMDRRSYLYIGDAIAWLLRMLLEPRDKIYNVGSEHDVSISDLANRIAQGSGHNLQVSFMSAMGGEGNFRRPAYLPSTERIRSDYPELSEWTDLDKTIDNMLAAHHCVSPKNQQAFMPA